MTQGSDDPEASDRGLRIGPRLTIDERELEERFTRAGGPGGQNVNKVSTAVQLRFDVARSTSLPEPVRARLRRLAGSRLSNDGILIIDARRFRTRERNREDARERLAALVREACVVPRSRVATRPTLGSKRRRLEHKRKRSQVKQGRGSVSDD